ncbi:FtsX-like permease family protein [Fulvivirga sedimenti]|uniref:FtsX-like permease family protein n=1 Tax=Fulvivirga sedimenti TaxID=2879465 RepID=A0A9X1HP73_9BACT|nr:FtsX-like permease family protein [Fulvivirga sedimenti]MCA6074438.1 FtsX-like permease family protein [Fulvivirga sedimenti]
MNLPLFIARKYFLSKRKRNFINIISGISMLIVAVCTAALIIVLSVFNGLEDLLRSLYNTFDPQIKVEATMGKSFHYTPTLADSIQMVEGVDIVTEVIEDYAYVKYRDADMVVTIKGVSDNFLEQKRIDSAIVMGELRFHDGPVNYAIIGRGVKMALSITPGSDIYPLQVHYIKDVKSTSLDPSNLYSRKSILAGSVFAIEKNYDDNYVFVPLEFARELLDYEDRRTSLEIKVAEGTDIDVVKERLSSLLGDRFSVQNNEEQHQDLYKLLNLEKVFVFIAFSFILGVGSINIFFALSMLAIDKKKDISVLYAMGANDRLIRRIFILEGVIISLGGALIGMLAGAGICWLQQNYGIVSMGMETSVLENYPVKMKAIDFLYTSAALIGITFLISYRPAIIATRYQTAEHL